MLELLHLKKIYRTGKSETRALDDVSLTFDRTGLVFLLGRSGSGKSTLLNLAGGLDSPTEGEVIVMGKSSKDFSGSDFDSYRNTYVGFIFQEYNVLDEFNVEDNIALALELQGKPKDRARIAEILSEVELSQFAKRKPNTLSGGQKQRIAIARALVKDPQIIMADEPTGALDSATGKQVFDTLKKLSESRLVIVVSHDREFAETYGDRIIELKDGKVISDVTKTTRADEQIAQNLYRTGENTLTFRRGQTLNEDTMSAITAFLREGEGDVILTKDPGDIAAFRKSAGIGESGRSVFEATGGKPRYTGEKASFIRSRLPAGKAVKIGASGLRLKPFRLAFTILLSVVSFILFGLSSTMMFYDGNAVLVESFKNSDYAYVTFSKYCEVECTYNGRSSYTTRREALFTPAEVASFGDAAFGAYRSYNTSVSNIMIPTEKASYYQPTITFFATLPEGHPLREQLGENYPKGKDEIAVSAYFLDCAKNGTFYDVTMDESGMPRVGDVAEITSEADLIGKRIPLMGMGIAPKITAVFDDGGIPAKFDALKEPPADLTLQMDFGNYCAGSLTCVAFVSQEYIDAYADTFMGISPTFVPYFPSGSDWFEFRYDASPYDANPWAIFNTSSFAVYDPDAELKLPVTLFGEAKGKSALEDGQFILPVDCFESLISCCYEGVNPPPTEPQTPDMPQPEWPGEEPTREQYDSDAALSAAHAAWEEKVALYNEWQAAQEVYSTEMEEYSAAIYAWNEANHAFSDKLRRAVGCLSDGRYFDEEQNEMVQATEEQKAEAKEFLDSALEKYAPYLHLTAYLDEIRTADCTVVGYYLPPEGNVSYNDGAYCSQSFYDGLDVVYNDRTETTDYITEPDATYLCLFAPLEKTDAALNALFARLETVDEHDVYYTMSNSLYTNITGMVNTIIEMLSQVFLWVGIVLALFASLMLFNFISMSIANKKKEIGILRAVGARGLDVFKIFFAESGIIVGICTVISLVGSAFAASFLNGILRAEAGIEVALFVFGPLSALLMMGLALAVALISTFLPVWFAARKKPVESIRAL